MKKYDFLIIGAGIFGVNAAIELAKRKYTVGLLNPDKIPHPLAASTDISKIIRMEYGSDVEYMEMAADSMKTWRAWNDLLREEIYSETGFILLAGEPMENKRQAFENASYQNLLKKNRRPERLNASLLSKRFPAFSANYYQDGFYHAEAGYARSGRAVGILTDYARQLGVDVQEGQTAEELIYSNGRMEAVKTREGAGFVAGHVVLCAGNFTPYLLPELKPFMKVSGHPVFHLKPDRPEWFKPPHFAVFAADISNTGWYGFPLHPQEQVVKIANHGVGLELHPEYDERIVAPESKRQLRAFLKAAIPSLADAPIVYTRLCCYTDTLDGHFWIDNHPEIKGLSVGSGGSGHGFKMGPVVGKMIADVAENKTHKWSDRYRWRELSRNTRQEEEARFGGER